MLFELAKEVDIINSVHWLKMYSKWNPFGVQTVAIVATCSYIVISSAVASLCLYIRKLPSEIIIALTGLEAYQRLVKLIRATGYALFIVIILVPDTYLRMNSIEYYSFHELYNNFIMIISDTFVCVLVIELAIWLVLRRFVLNLMIIIPLLIIIVVLDVMVFVSLVSFLYNWSWARTSGFLEITYWPGALTNMLRLTGVLLLYYDIRRPSRWVWREG